MRFGAVAIAPFLVAMSVMSMLSIGVSAERNRISVTSNDVKFNVDYFDDSRLRPYRVVFWENGRNIFYFDSAGNIEVLSIGTERYRVKYVRGEINRVTLTSSDRRGLTQQDEDEHDDVDNHRAASQTTRAGHRRLYSCDDCDTTWATLCDVGVPLVCTLVGDGSPLSTEASAAIEVVCNTFGDACSGSTGTEACEGQCGLGEDDDEGLNACLDPTSDQYKCEFTQSKEMRLEDCGLVDDDLPYLPACFETFGKTNLQELYFAYNVNPTNNVVNTFPEDTFAGLTEMTELNIGYLGLTSLPAGLFSGLSSLSRLSLYYNNLTALPSGIFSGLVSMTRMYLYENSLVTLPDSVFEGLSALYILNLDDNELVGFPAEAFSGMGTPMLKLYVRNNNLTTLPDGLFSDILSLDTLAIVGNPGLQCIPATQGEIIFFWPDDGLEDIITDGMCECSPEEAVMCGAGTSCEPGAKGYTCV